MTKRGSKLHKALDRRRWEEVRRQAFDRDGWRCRACGMAGALEADHIKPLRAGGDAYGLDNLQTLCRDCHRAKSRGEALAEISPDRRAWLDFMDIIGGRC